MNTVTTMNPQSANRRYLIHTTLFMGGYVAANLAAIAGAFDDITPRGAWALAIVVSAPIIGHIWAFLAWMRESDEFVRGMAMKRLAVATGITLALCSMWGLMEFHAKTTHISPMMIVPVFWLAYAAVSPFIRTSH